MSDSRKQFIISVMSRDRVGIVFEVSSAISELNGRIADMRQSVLRGYFTMILLASFPPSATAEAIRQKLATVDSRSTTPLEIAIKPVADVAVTDGPGITPDTYVLTASGKARIGFVATVSRFCAENNINILDIATSSTGDQFMMILLVDLGRCPQRDSIHHRLKEFSQDAGIKMVLQHYDIFKATNEITYDSL